MNPAPASVAAAWLRPMLCCVTPSWARCRYTWVSCSPQNPPNTVNTARNLAVNVVKVMKIVKKVCEDKHC